MVDHGRCREPSMCFAPHTQRMLPQVRLAEPLRNHAWRQTVGLGAGADALHSTNRLSDWDSLGACRASYISSAQQSQPLQLSVVSAESFFNAFWYCSFTQATLSFSSSAMASHVAA